MSIMRIWTGTGKILFLSLTISFLSACTSKPFPDLKKEFLLEEVQTLKITKKNPLQNDFWSATFIAVPLDLEKVWKISEYSEKHLEDILANATSINHLLSASQTLRWTEKAPASSLENLGLSPPFYDFTWTVKNKTFQLTIGQPISGTQNQNYAQLSISEGKIQSTTGPWIVGGSFLRLLNAILSSFDSLRLKIIFPFDTDEVMAVSFYSANKENFQLVRANGKWARQSEQKLLKPEGLEFMNKFLNLSIDRFIDKIHEKEALQSYFSQQENKLITIEFQRLHQKKSTLKIGVINNKVFASLSDRASQFFEIPPTTYNELKNFFKFLSQK